MKQHVGTRQGVGEVQPHINPLGARTGKYHWTENQITSYKFPVTSKLWQMRHFHGPGSLGKGQAVSPQYRRQSGFGHKTKAEN